MDKTLFERSPSGVLTPTIEGQHAFVPHALPCTIELDLLAIPLANAMQAMGELRGACRRLQDPYMLVHPMQRREALTSSSMEGTHTSADDLAMLGSGVSVRDGATEATVEVMNYIRALNSALVQLETLPISHRVMKAAHATLLSGLTPLRGSSKRPGEFKVHQNWIGGETIDAARFVPPPPDVALDCMDDLEKFINREEQDDIPALIEMALVHYQFETIHPFADGNGRVGRMLISLMAVQRGLLDMPVLYMSPYLEVRKDQYIDLMFNVSAYGDWNSWIEFFLEAVRESSMETVSTIDALIDLQSHYRDRATEASSSSNLVALVDSLFETPVVTVPNVAQRLGMTYRGASKIVDKLVEINVLRKITEIDTRPQAYIAPEVIRISSRRTEAQ